MNNELLRFVCNNTQFAFGVSEIREITNISQITQFPNASESVLGVTLVRGESVTVIDLPHLLFKTKSNVKDQSLTVLLCNALDGVYALYVHSVNGIIRASSAGSRPDRLIGTDSLVKEYFFQNDEIIMCLDMTQILDRCIQLVTNPDFTLTNN